MTDYPDTSPITVACHLRPSLLLDTDPMVETLRRCATEDRIDTLLLRSWPKEAPFESEGPFLELVHHYRRFERWADQYGVSIHPPFRRRSSTSLATDTKREVLVTPVLCLALYHGSRLIGVYPHSDGDDTYTVGEAIERVRDGEIPTPLGDPKDAERTVVPETGFDEPEASRSTARTPLDRSCPDCGSTLVNVQGVRECIECKWNDLHLQESQSSGIPEP